VNPRHLIPIPRLIRLFALLVAIDEALFTLFRVVFYLLFSPRDNPLPAAVVAKSFYLGAKFDLRLALLMTLPLLLLGWIRPVNPFERRAGRILWTAYLSVANIVVFFTYLLDFGHYAYNSNRVNITVVQFLYNLDTSLLMVWQTYPIVWGALGSLLFIFAAWRLVAWLVVRGARDPVPPGTPFSQTVTAVVLAVLLAAGGIYGKISWYQLRWSDAYFSTSSFSADLALNPVLFFADTFRKKPRPYDITRTRESYPLTAEFLGVDHPDERALNFARRRTPTGILPGRPNVVIVILESFCDYKTGVFGNPLGPTPNFDALARRSLLFRRFYTPTWGTARSVFATVTSLPDVETHKTSTRNPLIVTQHTLINEFKDYAKFYFLGGSLTWANIRGLLSHNIEGLRIYEEGSYEAPRIDVWGISDLHLFEEANRVFRAQQQPFFAIVQTSGNHRPYTIPEDSRGFTVLDLPEGEVKKHGFVSTAEFNAFRFMDHSIGLFLEQASKEAYYRDTIFVFYGDHGLPGRAPHIPRGEEELLITRFHVPLVIFAPGAMREGKVLDTVGSELDVLPTVAALAGVPTLNASLGRDLLDPAFDRWRFAFTIGEQSSSPQLGLIGKDRFFGMFADGSGKGLYPLDGGDPRQNLLDKEPETGKAMEQLTRAVFETARYMPFFNAPDKIRETERLAGGAPPPAR
jgi:phosphoglycerol transferase MdoB-like AlkP superfamily enzyme